MNESERIEHEGHETRRSVFARCAVEVASADVAFDEVSQILASVNWLLRGAKAQGRATAETLSVAIAAIADVVDDLQVLPDRAKVGHRKSRAADQS